MINWFCNFNDLIFILEKWNLLCQFKQQSKQKKKKIKNKNQKKKKKKKRKERNFCSFYSSSKRKYVFHEKHDFFDKLKL